MAFPRSDVAAPPAQQTPAGTAPAAPVTVKIVVAGGFAVGKTTFIGSISDIEPLSTEAAMTEHSVGVDDAGGVTDLAKKIHKASHILVVGVDLAASLSWLLAYALVPLGFSAEAPVGSAGNVRHKVRVLGKNDLLIVISFGRCLRESVEAAISARERGVPTFGITDGPATPVALHCDRSLIVTVGSPLFTGSYVAPVALIDAILMACSQIRPTRSLAKLRQSEEEYFSGDRFYQEPARRRGQRKQQLLRQR